MLHLRRLLRSGAVAVPSQLSLKVSHSVYKPLETTEFVRMGGLTLRKAIESAAHDVSDEQFWRGAMRRTCYIASDIKYWDSVEILRSIASLKSKHAFFRHGNSVPDWVAEAVYALSDSIRHHSSQLVPKNLVECLEACESIGLRHEALYVELFHDLHRLTPAMYGIEFESVAGVLARSNLADKRLLRGFSAGIIKNINQLSFRNACVVAGAMASLHQSDHLLVINGWTKTLELSQNQKSKEEELFDLFALMTALTDRAKFEVSVMRAEDVFNAFKELPELTFSWQPFEGLLYEKGLVPLLKSLQGPSQLNCLTAPMDFFCFLKVRGLLDDSVLTAFALWAKDAAGRPPTRMGKRALLDEILVVADECVEREVCVDQVKEALRIFRETMSGKPTEPKPLRYVKGRRYVRGNDAYGSLVAVRQTVASMDGADETFKDSNCARRKVGERPVWLKFPLPKYFNK